MGVDLVTDVPGEVGGEASTCGTWRRTGGQQTGH